MSTILTEEEALASAWCVPWQVDPVRRTVLFLELTPERHAAVTFHAPPELTASTGRTIEVALDDVARHYATRSDEPLRLVFHHAFACSTLLARSLGGPEALFTHREPFLLTQLAMLEHQRARPIAPVDLAPLLGLLARTEPGRRPLVKAADAVTNLAGRVLDADPHARAVLLHTDLETFAIGCLKAPERVTWMRGRLPMFATWDLPEGIATVDLDRLDDAEAAAWVWLVHMSLFRALRARLPERTLSLDAEVLVREPEPTTTRVAGFLGLDVDAALDQVARERPRHAKTHEPYGAEDRRRELFVDRVRLDDALDRARAFVERLGAPVRGADWMT